MGYQKFIGSVQTNTGLPAALCAFIWWKANGRTTKVGPMRNIVGYQVPTCPSESYEMDDERPWWLLSARSVRTRKSRLSGGVHSLSVTVRSVGKGATDWLLKMQIFSSLHNSVCSAHASCMNRTIRTLRLLSYLSFASFASFSLARQAAHPDSSYLVSGSGLPFSQAEVR